MLTDPPDFAEFPLDYRNCELDPRENPMYVQYAYLNKGMYPPEFELEQERYIEDVNNRAQPDFKHWKIIAKLTRLVQEDMAKFKQKK